MQWNPHSRQKSLHRQRKGKVVLVLSFNWAPGHGNVLEEWRYSSTHSLTSVLDGGEWSASRPCRFTPGERAPDTHWIGGWMGPRASLDAVVKRKIPSPCRASSCDNTGRLQTTARGPKAVRDKFSLRCGDIRVLSIVRYFITFNFSCTLESQESKIGKTEDFDGNLNFVLPTHICIFYEGVSKSFRSGRLERELQMVKLSATRCSCIAILWVSLASFAAITLCVASQRVFIIAVVYFVIGSIRKLLDTPSYVTYSSKLWQSTTLPHGNINKYTWTCPDGNEKCVQNFGRNIWV
jgi:hypothetical protein